MTKQETIQVLQSIEDRATDFPYMTACDWVAIAAAKRHLQEEPVSEELEEASRSYSDNIDNICGSIGEQVRNSFKAGAKWQKEKDMASLPAKALWFINLNFVIYIWNIQSLLVTLHK